MKLLNKLQYRALLCLLIGLVYAIVDCIIASKWDAFLYVVFIVAVVAYIPITLLWAIISTFFIDEDKSSEENVIDS